MANSRPRRFPSFTLWIALVLAALGWSQPASAQQSTPVASTPAGFQPPKLLTHPAPGYPELAHLNRVEGMVRIHFAIDETGHVTDLAFAKTSGSVMLDNVIRDPVLREWTFQPATLNGQPIAGGLDKEIEFRLDPVEERALAEKRLALTVGTPDPPYPPEALALHPPPAGKCTVGVRWTKAGLVDLIYLPASSGSSLLNRAALRFAYQNWRTDPATAAKDEAFTKTINFTPP